MTHAFGAEWIKLRRPSVLIGAAGLMVVVAAIATIVLFKSAGQVPVVSDEGTRLSLGQLAGPVGLSRGFAEATTFIGLIVLSLFAISVAGEFTQGTIRPLLLVEPRRLRLITGKIAALLSFVALALVVAAATSMITAAIAAGTRGVSMSQWTTISAMRILLSSWSTAFLGVALWGLVGAALGLLLRSTALALGLALAWLLPLEHILSDGWTGANHWFPGLLLEGFSRGGDGIVPWIQAGLAVGAYATVLTVAGISLFVHRDVTA